MTVDPELLAERSASVLAHLDRVATALPEDPADLRPMPSASDTVVLHLWQAIQIVIDLAMAASVRLGTGTPATYGDAFRLLADAGVLEGALAERLARAAAFRDLIVHADGKLDLTRVHTIAATGPADSVRSWSSCATGADASNPADLGDEVHARAGGLRDPLGL